jgi:excisionase family DNA binding protein
MQSEYLTVADVVEIFRCHPETVKRMARDGKLPAIKFGDRWFFPKEDFARYLSEEAQSRLRRTREKRP